jgi:4,5-DOPA dioxygenase extradiol
MAGESFPQRKVKMTEKIMPVLFMGHGSPMNAIEDNEFSRGWREMAKTLPEAKAILCISAHWETRGTFVTAMENPRTIHDFGGFPQELYDVEYPAPGSPWLAQETQKAVKKIQVGLDEEWGLDHGCWSVLKQMFPGAEVPVVQLSLDHFQPALFHYELAKELLPLRQKGVLIVGSGNIVHNLGRVVFGGSSMSEFNQPFGFPWALEAQALLRKLMDANDYRSLSAYHTLGEAVNLAVPTPEHYLPMLYALALKQEGETLHYYNDVAVAGSLTMTSFIIR